MTAVLGKLNELTFTSTLVFGKLNELTVASTTAPSIEVNELSLHWTTVPCVVTDELSYALKLTYIRRLVRFECYKYTGEE